MDEPAVHTPLAITPETFHGWQLSGVIDDLLASDAAMREGKTARTLVKTPALTVVLNVLRQGHHLHEHHAPAPVMVIPLRGEVVFRQGDEATPVGVENLELLAMGPGQVHKVEALTDSAFLLVLGPRP